nr:transcription factor GTE12-like [Ipomoea batatas]
MTIANLKMRISTGKRDDREKGLTMMRNDNKNLESKKRCFDDDFKVDGGKEKRQRIMRMDYFSIREDCTRVLPIPLTMIHRRDCQNKPKSHESSEKDCRRNPGGRDCQDTEKTPLQKEKESCSRADHSSSPRATIDEVCNTSQLSPTRALRAAQIKKRYAHLIFKATHQPLLMPLKQGDHYKHDPLQERERLQKQEIAQTAKIEEEVKAAQTLLQMRADPDIKIQRQREREAARIALDKMEKSVEFNDALQIMRDYESLLNAGLKMMRNILTENKKLESNKKRGFDDDFKVDDGKEKRRRRMDYRQRVLRVPPTMIHRGGWDCQNKPKSHESSEQDCLRNRGGRDCQNKPKNHESCGRNPGGRGCQDTKKTPSQKEKESCCRSDHCSARATIDEGCTTSQLSPTKALRAAQIKKRYAHLIFKATHQPLLMPLGDPLKQQ